MGNRDLWRRGMVFMAAKVNAGADIEQLDTRAGVDGQVEVRELKFTTSGGSGVVAASTYNN